jgi:hypothetical protein
MLWSRWPVYERVLINLVDGSALEGLLIDRRGPLLVMSDATLLQASSEPAQLDGEVYVERSRVLFLQSAQPRGL